MIDEPKPFGEFRPAHLRVHYDAVDEAVMVALGTGEAATLFIILTKDQALELASAIFDQVDVTKLGIDKVMDDILKGGSGWA